MSRVRFFCVLRFVDLRRRRCRRPAPIANDFVFLPTRFLRVFVVVVLLQPVDALVRARLAIELIPPVCVPPLFILFRGGLRRPAPIHSCSCFADRSVSVDAANCPCSTRMSFNGFRKISRATFLPAVTAVSFSAPNIGVR